MIAPHNPFDGAPVIFRYTRKQAVEDGVLVDLTEWARETGFKIPVACTDSVWHRYIVPPDGTRELGQCERGRAHDLVWMLRCAIRRAGKSGGDRLNFQVIFLQAPNSPLTVTLKSIIGPGDTGEPVLTLMLPDED